MLYFRDDGFWGEVGKMDEGVHLYSMFLSAY